jgi:organic hydroperoxide reductase OsmC/OhrA
MTRYRDRVCKRPHDVEGASMQLLPHHYKVTVRAEQAGAAALMSSELDPLTTAPPREFEGPGNQWSPETLFVGAVADCYVLSFRAVARAAKLPWTNITCEGEGTVDCAEGATRFTEIRLRARLWVPHDVDQSRAQNVLQQAGRVCVVRNSLRSLVSVLSEVFVEEGPHALPAHQDQPGTKRIGVS